MPLSESHSARSDETYDGPLSDNSRGRCMTLALSQPEACSAMVSVSVTSPAFMVVHSFQDRKSPRLTSTPFFRSDLALGLGMTGCTAGVIHALVGEPFGKVGRDV